MKKRSIASLRAAAMFAGLCAVLPASVLAADPVRSVTSFDTDWRFFKGDATGAQAATFDVAQWRAVNVPFDWSIEGPLAANNPSGRAGGFAPSGVAWYRKSFTLPAADSGKRLFIDFDGVMANSDVWINGFHLGKRPYGYVSFQYELTGHVNLDGKPNVLAVRSDTSQQPASRWYSGGGIYRHVRLEATNAVHIDNWGTFVTTPKVAADGATVHVRSTVVNQSDAARNVSLQVTLLDPDGKSVATAETKPQAVAAGKTADFDQDVAVATPKLWDLDHPLLYTTQVAVRADNATIDDQSVPIGIRLAEFKADTGFWLNGRNFKIKGVCIHGEAGGLGTAVPEDEYIHRINVLKSLGVNAIRFAHNPPSPEFLDACDRTGMLVMDEMFDCWTVAKNPFDYHLYFREWNLIDTRDTIRRDRNHASIILYSTGNEIHDTPNVQLSLGILGPLVRTIHDLDPTHPVTQALFRPNSDGGGGAYKNGLADLLDVVGTNYRDAELLAAHAAKPSMKIIGTEQGRPLNVWAEVRDHPAYAGHFIWTGVDYLGEGDAFPEIGTGSGIVDISDRPKTEGLQRASWWSDTPVVYMIRGTIRSVATTVRAGAVNTPTDWTPANLSPHAETVQVFSNCDEVELFLNGQSLGAKPRGAVDSIRTWNVQFAPGTLKAVGKNKGQVVTQEELTTAGKAAKVALKASTAKLFADFDSIAHVTVTVVDDKGIEVPAENGVVTFKVAGPGEIAAVENGHLVNQNFRGNSHALYEGQCVAFVRATGPDGKITLTASAPGLADATLTFDAGPARPGH